MTAENSNRQHKDGGDLTDSSTWNALFAKVMVKYGRRLKDADYSALSAASSVSEIAEYLKNSPAYGEAFAETDPSLLHRGQIEEFVRKSAWEEYYSLLSFTGNDNDCKLSYLLRFNEIEQILSFLALLNSGAPDRYGLSLPSYMAHSLSFDLHALSAVRSYDELCGFLSQTPYYGALKKHVPDTFGHIDLSRLECDLFAPVYERLVGTKKERYGEKTSELFAVKLDMTNISRLLRLRLIFGLRGENVKSRLIPVFCRIKQKTLDDMAECDVNEIYSRLLSTPYGKYFDGTDLTNFDRRVPAIQYGLCRRIISSNESAQACVTAFVEIKQFEVKEIIRALECVRYGRQFAVSLPLKGSDG